MSREPDIEDVAAVFSDMNDDGNPHAGTMALSLASIAISLKRIADSMEGQAATDADRLVETVLKRKVA